LAVLPPRLSTGYETVKCVKLCSPLYAKFFPNRLCYSDFLKNPFICIYHISNSCYFSLPYYSLSLANLTDVPLKRQTMVILSAYLHLFLFLSILLAQIFSEALYPQNHSEHGCHSKFHTTGTQDFRIQFCIL
jgi:hypothetical protein